MKWYSGLYLGESVRHPRSLRWKIDHNAGTRAHVIVLPVSGSGILEIIPTWVLLQKEYPGKKQLQIVGLSGSYNEALEVVTRIVLDTYENTGSVDVAGWLRKNRRKDR